MIGANEPRVRRVATRGSPYAGVWRGRPPSLHRALGCTSRRGRSLGFGTASRDRTLSRSARHRGKPDNSLVLVGERDRAVRDMTREVGARAHAELAVDPGQMGFDGGDGREELRSDFAIRLPRRYQRRDLPFSVRQLTIAPGSRPRPPQLLLGSLCPQTRSEVAEDRCRGLERLGGAPALTFAAKRVTGDKQRAATVERETGSLEGIGRLLALRRRFDGVSACEQAQRPRSQRRRPGPAVAVPSFAVDRLHAFVDGLELAKCGESLDVIRNGGDDFQHPPRRY